MMIRWSLWLDKKTVATLISDRRAEGAPGSAGSFAKPSKTLWSEGSKQGFKLALLRPTGEPVLGILQLLA